MKKRCALNNCTGCGACIAVCPQKCIKYTVDDEGFYVPFIDRDICINCGKCERTCPAINAFRDLDISQDVYAAQIKDRDNLVKSSSGGIGYQIGKYFISNGGAIVGCCFDKDLVARHILVDDLNRLKLIQGSKYVQSDISDSYNIIKAELSKGKKVVFFGTPCQVAGIRSVFGNNNSLFTVDLICHGVSSPRLFKNYIDWLEYDVPDDDRRFSFRDKSFSGWGTICSYTVKKDKIIFSRSDMDPYYSDFLEGRNYRECCYSCKYAKKDRVGDITIGDFWGISKEHPEFENIKLGVSVVIVNTQIGLEVFENIKPELVYVKSSIEKAAAYNGNLSHPVNRPLKRTGYYKILESPYKKHVKKFHMTKKYIMAAAKNYFKNVRKV